MNFPSDHIGQPEKDRAAAMCRNYSIEIQEMAEKLRDTKMIDCLSRDNAIEHMLCAVASLRTAADELYSDLDVVIR